MEKLEYNGSGGHGASLQYIIETCNAKVVCEVGINKGRLCRRTLKILGSRLSEYWAVDMWKDIGPGHAGLSKRSTEEWESIYCDVSRLSLYYPQLRILRMSSQNAAEIFQGFVWKRKLTGYFDVVYIDASHFYEDVQHDIRLWYPLVKDTGILAGHDYSSKRWPDVKPAVDAIFGDKVYSLSGASWAVWKAETSL